MNGAEQVIWPLESTVAEVPSGNCTTEPGDTPAGATRVTEGVVIVTSNVWMVEIR